MQTVWDAQGRNQHVPFSATAIGAVFLSAGGLLNTLLYVSTRKDLLFFQDDETTEGSEEEYKEVSRETSPERELPSNFNVDAGY